MQSTPEQKATDPALKLLGQLYESVDVLLMRIDAMEMQLQRIEKHSDTAARELAEISRDQWIQRSIAATGR